MNHDACFLFRGDIRFDSRLNNFVSTFTKEGKTCLVIQGAKSNETFTQNGAEVISVENTRLGPSGFYEYWLRASHVARGIRAQVWWAAELYSLPLAVRRARATGGRSAYDAREIFAHLGGLEGRWMAQSFWRWMERRYIGRAHAVVTTGAMDAEFLATRYKIVRPIIVRNLPRFRRVLRSRFLHDRLSIPHSTPICLYTGGLQSGRGMLPILKMAGEIPEAAFVFVGSGPLEPMIASHRQTLPNVFHLPEIPNEQVIDCAASATIGFALIEPISLSYQYALPNKLFEYIMAGTPVIVSDMPQMTGIVERYKVGLTVSMDSHGEVVAATRRLLTEPDLHRRFADNCKTAASELNWEKEEESFVTYARQVGML